MRRWRRPSGLVIVLALAACGGRTVLESAEPEVVVIVEHADAAPTKHDDLVSDAASVDAAIADTAIVDAGVDALPEASVEVDAGSGICPAPPLLTAASTPLAPSWVEGLAMGNEHTCLLIDGQVWCWGQNKGGELGDGTQVSRARPTKVTGITNAVTIASGPAFDYGCLAARGSHTCALLNDATVKCWGANVSGDAAWTISSFEPFAIPGLDNVLKLGIAGYSSCAVLRDGSASCWGVSPTPVPSKGMGFIDVAAGLGVSALAHDGTVWSWNATTYQAAMTVTVPVKVPSLTSIVRITAGWGHTCALRSDGTVWCWGANFAGQLGDGTYTNSLTTPVQVADVSNAVFIAAGGRHTCAIVQNGILKCWGDNSYGQMGNGSIGGTQPTAMTVPNFDKAIEVRGGFYHLCARRWSDLSVWCWGRNETGQVGDGTTIDRASPVSVFP